MDGKFNPKDKFHCVRRGVNLTYLECQAYFLEGSYIECNDTKNRLACVTGEENDHKINQCHGGNKKRRGRPPKMKTEAKSTKGLEPEAEQSKPKRIELKRQIYFSSRPDLCEKIERLAKASIRTFNEQVLWMIQEYFHSHPEINDFKFEIARQKALTELFISAEEAIRNGDHS